MQGVFLSLLSIIILQSLNSIPFVAVFDQVRFAYPALGGQSGRAILQNVSLRVPRGKVTAIMGGSGSGKTTLLRMIGGQIKAQSGQVLLNGEDVGAMGLKRLYEVRQGLGMLFQFGALFSDRSVFDNVAFPLRENTNLSEAMIHDMVLMMLNAVGLRGARDLLPSALSGGMAKRVALARAIALSPALLLYDEPFAGLDSISLNAIAKLVRQLNDALGITSVLVSHDLQETLSIADQIVFLADGEVVVQGSPQEVLECQDPRALGFFHPKGDEGIIHYPAPSLESDFLQQ